MKTSVISKEFRDRYLSDPKDPDAFEGRAIVFDGPGGLSPPHRRSGAQHRRALRCCSSAAPGRSAIRAAPRWSTCSRPAYLLKKGVHALPCIGDGRQSGTSGSPSILNASPEAAAGGGLALLKTGDRVRIDLDKGEANILISDEELAKRRAELAAKGGFPIPKSQTPWQEIQRGMVDQFAEGMVLKPAVKYQRVAHNMGVPRDNH